MVANGRALNHRVQTKENGELIRTSKPLTEHQQDAFAQIQHWFPDIGFDCYTRAIPNSVGQEYLVAIARLDSPGLTQGESNLVTQPIWIMATLPEISDKIFISAYLEHPKPFFDFMASLDSRSETADQMVEGYRAKVQHTILENRNQKSFILAGFSHIWPKLVLNPKKVFSNASIQYMKDKEFTGLLVLFSQQPFSRLDQSAKHLYELNAIARNAQHLADVALSEANMNYLDEPTEEQAPISEQVAALISGQKINAEYQSASANISQVSIQTEIHSLSPKDQKILRQIRSRTRTTRLLFILTLVAGTAAAYSYYTHFM